MSQKEINEFMKNSRIDQPATPEEFKAAVKNAYKDRTRQVYFIWKKLKELYPDVDANRVIREGSWDFGYYQGQKIAKKYGAENIGPKEALLGQTSRSGLLVFEQEIQQLEKNKAVKIFNACPHCEALKELGLSPEEIKMFCHDMLGHCDYAICAAFPNVEIDFPTTIADGEGKGCAMTITQKRKE
ncbi:MAG: L-2-amino-thiazoline-4-carboxylic acid hydrolase [Succiniclasticum sp.]|nr:L-2-amino-thiazoline-4-carboxylic acid hydrolase [Succiniclasticum sp.]MDY6086419.1 L-2-amino-thiazoline-4-carboxylic acid hydrolase [Succiniclasticum sp.]